MKRRIVSFLLPPAIALLIFLFGYALIRIEVFSTFGVILSILSVLGFLGWAGAKLIGIRSSLPRSGDRYERCAVCGNQKPIGSACPHCVSTWQRDMGM